MASTTVYLVEADPAIQDSLSTLLDLNGYEVRTFEAGLDFLATITLDNDALCIVCEAQLPDISAFDLHEALQRIKPGIPFALLISRRDEKVVSAARQHGITRFFQKPLVYRRLLEFVSALPR